MKAQSHAGRDHPEQGRDARPNRVGSRLGQLLLALALVGCGTTVPGSQLSSGGAGPDGGGTLSTELGLDGDELGTDAPGAVQAGEAAEPVAGGDSSTSTSRGPGTSGGSASGAVGDPGNAVGAGSGAAPNAVGHGPGVTASTVNIGYSYEKGTDEYQETIGNTSTTQGDVKRAAEAVVADINKNGGVANRKLKVVFHASEASDPSTRDTKLQAACSAFTDDNKVLIGIGLSQPPTFVKCMQAAGAATLDGTVSGMYKDDFARYPLFYDVQMLPTDRALLNLVDTLMSSGYFSRWNTTSGEPGQAPVKVGVLSPDQSNWLPAVKRVLVPELRRRGIPISDEHVKFWHFPESSANNGEAVADIQSAVLKMKADGVTHVLPVEHNSGFFFMPSAEAQRYRPRYGINTASFIQAFAGAPLPYEQLRGAVGVGWSPAFDLPESQNSDDGPYAGPGRARCLKVLREAGITFDSANAKGIALLTCDSFYSIQAALNGIPDEAPLTAQSFIGSVERLGASFQIAGLPRALFGPGKRYPVTQGWTMRWDDACKCSKYEGAPRSMR